MIKFAFNYFKINYENYTTIDRKFFRKCDFNLRKSNFKKCLARNNIKGKHLIYGKKIIYKLIKHYLNENKLYLNILFLTNIVENIITLKLLSVKFIIKK